MFRVTKFEERIKPPIKGREIQNHSIYKCSHYLERIIEINYIPTICEAYIKLQVSYLSKLKRGIQICEMAPSCGQPCTVYFICGFFLYMPKQHFLTTSLIVSFYLSNESLSGNLDFWKKLLFGRCAVNHLTSAPSQLLQTQKIQSRNFQSCGWRSCIGHIRGKKSIKI